MPKLEDLSLNKIRGFVKKYNEKVAIKGYSKLSKSDLIDKIRNHPRIEVHEGDTVKLKIVKDKRSLAQKVKEGREKYKKEQQKKAQAKQTRELKKQAKKIKITVTEPEKEKRKVMKVGGRFITPKKKEIKSDLPPIPKSNVKIRVGEKKPKIPTIKITEAKEEPHKEVPDVKANLPPMPKSKAKSIRFAPTAELDAYLDVLDKTKSQKPAPYYPGGKGWQIMLALGQIVQETKNNCVMLFNYEKFIKPNMQKILGNNQVFQIQVTYKLDGKDTPLTDMWSNKPVLKAEFMQKIIKKYKECKKKK